MSHHKSTLYLTLLLALSSCATQTVTPQQKAPANIQTQANGNLQVYYKKPTAWGNANIHYWNTV
ncbi:hypothetical protein, partial [Deinococcus roseus]|uniref:hypothetical protein n=1 Tax=Deinococcus roseus TaxID=392414 RepID=UPI00166863C5